MPTLYFNQSIERCLDFNNQNEHLQHIILQYAWNMLCLSWLVLAYDHQIDQISVYFNKWMSVTKLGFFCNILIWTKNTD